MTVHQQWTVPRLMGLAVFLLVLMVIWFNWEITWASLTPNCRPCRRYARPVAIDDVAEVRFASKHIPTLSLWINDHNELPPEHEDKPQEEAGRSTGESWNTSQLTSTEHSKYAVPAPSPSSAVRAPPSRHSPENRAQPDGEVQHFDKEPEPKRPETDAAIEWTTMTELGSVLKRIAVERVVIVCTVNQGYWDLFLNWLISLHKVGLSDRVLVFAEDIATWHRLQRHWPGHTVLFRTTETEPAVMDSGSIPQTQKWLEFGSTGYGELVTRRPSRILACLEHGYSVLYSDIDVVFAKNPFPYFTGHADGYFSHDGVVEKFAMNGSDRLPPPPVKLNFCTHFLLFRPTPPSIEVLQRWTMKLRQRNTTKNQHAFNDVLEEIRSADDSFFHFRVLPSASFPSGKMVGDGYVTKEWRESGGGDIVVFHANYHYGQGKVDVLKRYNFWFLNGSETSNLGGEANGQLDSWPSSFSQQ
ncbi:GT77-family glycosyltransferase [Chara braunii]|uniref:GT77-family glycosyltransferase n=1 Tax=Chara braunii TaxID=69332 RepID=A0A388JUV1_CHABU|nr:GT77-family glycosyltransferase [Chara braunii]|eukprot:GBG61565.1 GT77-family glycosyltransferase [Chara braunii]